MPRCPDCNKFCSVELDESATLEVEISNATLDEIVLNVTGEIELLSSCCGSSIGKISVEKEVVIPEEEIDAEYD